MLLGIMHTFSDGGCFIPGVFQRGIFLGEISFQEVTFSEEILRWEICHIPIQNVFLSLFRLNFTCGDVEGNYPGKILNQDRIF